MTNNSNDSHVNVTVLDSSYTKMAMEKWQKVPFSNRYMFRLVMEDPELCKRTLEVVLGISIKKLVYQEEEKSFESQLLSKGVRLDVYIEDEDNVVYDLELQASDDDGWALGKRTRYYQSMIDSNQLKKGECYSALKKSFVIFICCYDPFKYNLLRYTFSNYCHEQKSLQLGDESYKLFINTKGTIGDESQELLNFIDFVNTGNRKDLFTEKLAEAVRLKHKDVEKAVAYMTLEQEMQTREEKAKAEATEIINRLNALLIKAKRYNDLERSTEDRIFQDKLLVEYGLK